MFQLNTALFIHEWVNVECDQPQANDCLLISNEFLVFVNFARSQFLRLTKPFALLLWFVCEQKTDFRSLKIAIAIDIVGCSATIKLPYILPDDQISEPSGHNFGKDEAVRSVIPSQRRKIRWDPTQFFPIRLLDQSNVDASNVNRSADQFQSLRNVGESVRRISSPKQKKISEVVPAWASGLFRLSICCEKWWTLSDGFWVVSGWWVLMPFIRWTVIDNLITCGWSRMHNAEWTGSDVLVEHVSTTSRGSSKRSWTNDAMTAKFDNIFRSWISHSWILFYRFVSFLQGVILFAIYVSNDALGTPRGFHPEKTQRRRRFNRLHCDMLKWIYVVRVQLLLLLFSVLCNYI